MEKSKSKKTQKEMEHVGELVLKIVSKKDFSVAWLGRQIGRDSDNLRKQLKVGKHIHGEQLLEISKALKYDFFVPYSIFLHKNKYVDYDEENPCICPFCGKER